MTDEEPGGGHQIDSSQELIGNKLATLTRLRAKRQLIPKVFTAIGIAAFFGAMLAGWIPYPGEFETFTSWISATSQSQVGLAVIGLGSTMLIGIQVWFISREATLKAEIELLATKRRIAEELPTPARKEPADSRSSYFDSLVKINVENLAEYYSLVKVHTNNSFRASLATGLVGFILIIIGVLAGFGGAESVPPAKIAATAGVIVEFISGVFFFLYSRTVRQLKDYHDSLLAVQNILLSFKLVNDTNDAEAKREMTSQMCSYLLTGGSFPLPQPQGGLK